MRNILITLMFDGADFHGWQVQDNAVTIQQTLQNTIEKILGKRENIIGCSRTDSGVHANMFCCNMRTDSDISPEKLKKALNALLPSSISVKNCGEVPYSIHARYDCTSKEYKYLILNSDYRNPFLFKRALYYPYYIDTDMLNSEAQDFIGTHDFSAFCAAGSSVEGKIRTVKNASVIRNKEIIEVTFEADGFLYNMVRAMVGTCVYAADGKFPPEAVSEILAGKNRTAAGPTVPAGGLYMTKLWYREDVL